MPKNDYVDSFVIADCLRFGRINKEVYMGDYRLPKTVNDSVNQVLSISIPGIGPVYSAGIMAEIDDINRFDNQAVLAKYAGLA